MVRRDAVHLAEGRRCGEGEGTRKLARNARTPQSRISNLFFSQKVSHAESGRRKRRTSHGCKVFVTATATGDNLTPPGVLLPSLLQLLLLLFQLQRLPQKAKEKEAASERERERERDFFPPSLSFLPPLPPFFSLPLLLCYGIVYPSPSGVEWSTRIEKWKLSSNT